MTASIREDGDALSLHSRLKELFAASAPGCDDGAALQEVRRLCQNLRRLVHDTHCHAQLRQLERYARFFFAREAHEAWARDTGFGGNGLRGLVLQLLSAFELRLSQISLQQFSCDAALLDRHVSTP